MYEIQPCLQRIWRNGERYFKRIVGEGENTEEYLLEFSETVHRRGYYGAYLFGSFDVPVREYLMTT